MEQQTISMINFPQLQEQPNLSRQQDLINSYMRQLKKIESYIRAYEFNGVSVRKDEVPADIQNLQINTYWNS